MKSKEFRKYLQENGWVMVRNGKHQTWHFGNKGILIVSKTPSCPHAMKNIQNEARKIMERESK